jgi:hypothetical protein
MRYDGMKHGDIDGLNGRTRRDGQDSGEHGPLDPHWKSEIDAKLFAMQILSKGWTAARAHSIPISEAGRGTSAD